MTKTEHYQLNQWVPEDPVRREDFNQDNLNIENALVAHDEAVSAALKEHEQTAAARLAAVEKANCLIHLAGPVVRKPDDPACTIELPQDFLNDYTGLLLLSYAYDGSTSIKIDKAEYIAGSYLLSFFLFYPDTVLYFKAPSYSGSGEYVRGGLPGPDWDRKLYFGNGFQYIELYGIRK